MRFSSDSYYNLFVDTNCRCRWSTTGEPLLFVKSAHNKLNVLDVEKKALMMKDPISLEKLEDCN